jgi:hypothetical protein
MPVYEKGNNASVKNYRPVSRFNSFSKIFELIIYDHLFYYFKNKLNPIQSWLLSIQIYFYQLGNTSLFTTPS